MLGAQEHAFLPDNTVRPSHGVWTIEEITPLRGAELCLVITQE
jgi:hypothetical protein